MSKDELKPLFYCGEDLHEWKMNRVQELMKNHGFEGILFLKHDAVRYVTEFYTKGYRPFLDFDYLAIVPLGKSPIIGFSLGGEERRIKLRSRVTDARKLPNFKDWGSVITEILADYGITNGRIGFDILPDFIKEDLQVKLPKVELVDMSNLWSDLTAIKHEKEVNLIRKALSITEQGMSAAINSLTKGITEIELSAIAEYKMRCLGSEMNPFIPVVSSGQNAAIWERVATKRKIQDGDMVIMDFGCIYNGYTGDFARTTIVGTPTQKQVSLYSSAYNALQEAIKCVKPGVLCSAIDNLIRKRISEDGYGDYVQPWASGHQLGYGLHGAPTLNKDTDVPLQAGMVINIEPSLYTYDDWSIGGVELEDTVLVTETGYERLTNFPYEEKLLKI